MTNISNISSDKVLNEKIKAAESLAEALAIIPDDKRTRVINAAVFITGIEITHACDTINKHLQRAITLLEEYPTVHYDLALIKKAKTLFSEAIDTFISSVKS
ncbi:MAG: hypothetical protein M0R68_15330 [Bacteroidetes bacterium]|nr:hypothetical protein [Bacteroidota bacterium]